MSDEEIEAEKAKEKGENSKDSWFYRIIDGTYTTAFEVFDGASLADCFAVRAGFFKYYSSVYVCRQKLSAG